MVGEAASHFMEKGMLFVSGHILFVDGGILANFGYVKGETIYRFCSASLALALKYRMLAKIGSIGRVIAFTTADNMM